MWPEVQLRSEASCHVPSFQCVLVGMAKLLLLHKIRKTDLSEPANTGSRSVSRIPRFGRRAYPPGRLALSRSRNPSVGHRSTSLHPGPCEPTLPYQAIMLGGVHQPNAQGVSDGPCSWNEADRLNHRLPPDTRVGLGCGQLERSYRSMSDPNLLGSLTESGVHPADLFSLAGRGDDGYDATSRPPSGRHP